uniref:Polycomb group RING finger protein 1 n=1 Tax=Ficedula albicollis TaxID=59894 RepID=A0A803WDV0_FICAL
MKELNEHIVCFLCAGYFIDATTITECLHTFCKSCIVKYLQTSKYCPMCNTKIHETQPLLNLKLDRVMQDIVYKLVPGLQHSEEKRIREFYQSRGLDRVTQPSGDDTVGGDPMGLPYSTFDHSRAHYFRYDEHVSLCLEKLSSSKDKSKAVLQQKYVRCSVRAQIRHLRRVLCHRLGLSLQHVQILFDNEPLPDHMTMKQLWLSRWFGKVCIHHKEWQPLILGGGGVILLSASGQCGVGGLRIFNVSGCSCDLGRFLAHGWVRQCGGPQRGWPSLGCSPVEILGLVLGVPVPGNFRAEVWGLCPKGTLGWGLGSWNGVGEPLG